MKNIDRASMDNQIDGYPLPVQVTVGAVPVLV